MVSDLDMRRDIFREQITISNPMGGIDSYTYDAIGRVYTHTDPRQNTITYPIYDGLNRVRQVRYQDQSTKNIVYNCCGLESVTDSNGTVAIAYDEITKRPSTITDVYGKVISFTTYDKNGNLETLTYPGNKAVRYEYDKADRLIKVTDWLNNETRYEYTPAGDLFKTYYPNGTTVTYGYDNAHRLTSILDMKADGTVNSVYKYTLDSLGNRKEISLYQPLIAVPPTLSAVSSNYDNDNRLQVAGETDYEYDANGNLDTVTTGSDVRDHTWDYEDRLTRLTVGGNVYEYKYDGLGNRVSRKVNGVETKYVVDPTGLSKILAETDASGNITAYYVYGLGLISKITPADQVYYYHFDGIGSTVAITDSSGNIVNKYAYDEFGKVLSQEEAIPNPFKYVGQFGVMDEGNGLLYMRARYYDPESGRFISKDPIGFAGGDLNLYAYVGNNPVNAIDPEGKFIFLLVAPAVYTGAMALADLAIIGGLWWASQQALPSACEFSKGLGDKYGPLWKAPGMPGWTYPTSDPDDPDFMKEPKDFDKWPFWKRFWWKFRKIAAKAVTGFHNP